MKTVKIEVINKSSNDLPKYETIDSAGLDLKSDEYLVLKPMERALVKTELYMSIPKGYEAQIRPRSGLALKKGITLLNTPGTIDADYRGNIGVIMINLSNEDFIINKGDRIAQMVINKVERAEWVQVDKLDETERGEGGFGHTGNK